MSKGLTLTSASRGLGIAGHDFRGAPEELAQTFAGLGLCYLDYWPYNRGETPIDEYRDLLRRADLEVYTVNISTSRGRFGDLGLEGPTAVAARRALAEAVAFGAPYVQIYLGPLHDVAVGQHVERLAQSLAPYVEQAANEGVTVVIENNFDHRGEDPAEANLSRSPETLRDIVQAVGADNLRITFDHVNFVMSGVSPQLAWDMLAPYVVNVHLKDCVVLDHSDHGTDRRVLRDGTRRFARSMPVGSGDLPWRETLRHLNEQGYDGWFTLDPYCDPDDVLAWSAASMEFLRAARVQEAQS